MKQQSTGRNVAPLGRNISSLPHGPLKGPFPMKNIPKSCKIPKIFILATLFLFPNTLINPCLTLNNTHCIDLHYFILNKEINVNEQKKHLKLVIKVKITTLLKQVTF
jgi:hypothetical protein